MACDIFTYNNRVARSKKPPLTNPRLTQPQYILSKSCMTDCFVDSVEITQQNQFQVTNYTHTQPKCAILLSPKILYVLA